MKSNIIDVTVELKLDDPDKQAIAVYDGTDDEDGREIWIWLPRSQVEYEVISAKTIEVQIPEWLAQEKELIEWDK